MHGLTSGGWSCASADVRSGGCAWGDVRGDGAVHRLTLPSTMLCMGGRFGERLCIRWSRGGWKGRLHDHPMHSCASTDAIHDHRMHSCACRERRKTARDAQLCMRGCRTWSSDAQLYMDGHPRGGTPCTAVHGRTADRSHVRHSCASTDRRKGMRGTAVHGQTAEGVMRGTAVHGRTVEGESCGVQLCMDGQWRGSHAGYSCASRDGEKGFDARLCTS